MSLDPVGLVAPARILTPRPAPFLDRGDRVRPRYVPGPLAEGMTRVVLSSASYEEAPQFQLYDDYPTLVEPHRVFDIPTEQYERWQAAVAVFDAMQDEVEAMIEARSAATTQERSAH